MDILVTDFTYKISGTKPLTTGEVSRLVGCATRTIVKMSELGKLKFFKLPTGCAKGEDRRYYLDDVLAFMRETGMRIPRELEHYTPTVAFGVELEGIETFNDTFKFGVHVGKQAFIRTALIGTAFGQATAQDVFDSIKEHSPHTMRVLVLHPDEQLKIGGYDLMVRMHFDIRELLARCAEITGTRATLAKYRKKNHHVCR